MSHKKMNRIAISLCSVLSFSSISTASACTTTAECAQEAAETARGVVSALEASLPSGAVMMFAAEECPAPYWEEYTEAHGRFVRAIDKSGSNVDPDGQRKAGALQEDAIQSHTHALKYHSGGNQAGGGSNMELNTRNNSINTTGPQGARSASETRPKNIALLFCIKK